VNYPHIPHQVRIVLTNLWKTYELETYSFTALPAVQTRTVTIPSTVPTGTYAISVVVDPDDRIPESNENNNGDSVFVDVQKMIVVGPIGPIVTGTNSD